MTDILLKSLKRNLSAGGPLYKRLLTGIRRFCLSQPEGTPFPPERELASELGISRTALRHAFDAAEREKLIIRCWAKGSFVAKHQELKKILLLIPENTNITMPWNYILPGIHTRCVELNVLLSQMPVLFMRSQTAEDNLDFLQREQFTGILFFGSWKDAPELDPLKRSHLPVLIPHAGDIWCYTAGFPCERIDEKAAFTEALDYLISAGHRKIISIGLDVKDSKSWRGYDAQEYTALLKSRGADPSPELLVNVPYEQPLLEQQLGAVLKKRKDATAILCFSDFFAMMAMEFLRKRKIRIPGQLSVMGFCGYPGGAYLNPPLTTIDFDYYQIGIRSVDLLLEIAAGKEVPAKTDTPYRLCVRESVRSIGT